MVEEGATAKFAPDAEDPNAEPPLDALYQYIVLPEEIADKFEVPPEQNEAGEAVTDDAVAGVVP